MKFWYLTGTTLRKLKDIISHSGDTHEKVLFIFYKVQLQNRRTTMEQTELNFIRYQLQPMAFFMKRIMTIVESQMFTDTVDS